MAQGNEPQPLEVHTAAVIAPAGDEPVGGDFQFVHEVDARTVVIVGDVTGSGEPAAPYAQRLCGSLTEVAEAWGDPAEMLEELNTRVLNDDEFEPFVTVCVVIINRESRSAAWGFAGHLPPHWVDTGMPVDGATPGLPLGVQEQCGAISAHRRPLHPNEGFVIFTDGLEDVRGPGRDRFGSSRITSNLSGGLRGCSPEEIVSGLKEAACNFGDGHLEDDLCIVALRVS